MPLSEIIKQSSELHVDEQEALARVILKRTKKHRAQEENFYLKTFKFVISVSTASAIVYTVFSAFIDVFFGGDLVIILDTAFFYISKNANYVFINTVSLLILTILTYMAIKDIKCVIEGSNRSNSKKANSIAIFISSILTLFLFQQPYLDNIFGKTDTGTVMNSILFGGGAFAGWVIWYLKKLKNMGNSFIYFFLGVQ